MSEAEASHLSEQELEEIFGKVVCSEKEGDIEVIVRDLSGKADDAKTLQLARSGLEALRIANQIVPNQNKF